MSTVPLISVLIPTFKPDASHLKEALASVLSQSLSDFEVLVLDDSPAENRKMVSDICAEFSDSRLQLVQNSERLGLIGSLNDGLARARGAYIARMDADDICMPDRFDRQIKFLAENPKVTVCGSYFEVFGERNFTFKHPVIPQDIRDGLLLSGCVLGHPTVMMRKRELAALTSGYNPDFKDAEDYGLWATLSLKTDLANIPEVLLRYRHHSQQTSQVQSTKVEKSTRNIQVFLLLSLISETESTDVQKLLHAIIVEQRILNNDELESLAAVFNRLQSANSKNAFYTQAKFNSYLLDLWQNQFAGQLSQQWQRIRHFYDFRLVFSPSVVMMRRHLGILKRYFGPKPKSA